MKDKQIDNRFYRSQISDIMKDWKDSKRMEYLAMEWIAQKIYEKYYLKKMKVDKQ